MSTYFPFTGGPAAAEADWGLFAQLWTTDGVVRGADNEFAVSPTGTPDLNVHVATGEVWAQGYFGRKGTITDFTVAPDLSLPRKDIIVARANFSTHLWEILYRTGTPNASPSAPLATRTAGVTWDIVLAEVSVVANASSIAAGDIKDRRPFTASGVVRTNPVASANPLVIPNVDQIPQGFIAVVPVTGTTSFSSITGPSSGTPIIILEFAGILTITTDLGNLGLARSMTTQARSTLTLYWDSALSAWREIGRAREGVAKNLLLAGPASGADSVPSPRAMVQDDFPAGLWSTANPTSLLQLSGIAFSINSARLLKMGKFFVYQASITATAATGTGANPIIVTIPVTYVSPLEHPLGVYYYKSTALAFEANGNVRALNGSTTIHFMGSTEGVLGVAPNFAVQIGDVIQFNLHGELA
jgi:hypothetical protein